MAEVKQALWQLKSVCRAETVLLWKTYRCQMEEAYGLRLQVRALGPSWDTGLSLQRESRIRLGVEAGRRRMLAGRCDAELACL